jgi:hypothetical protein
MIARLWRRLFPIYRWRCAGCTLTWEQRDAPGFILMGPPHPDGKGRRRHAVFTPDVRDGWDYGTWQECGPISVEARKVA